MRKLVIIFFVVVSCEQNKEWIYLFDGETTDGWRGYNSEIMPPGWIVENGVLTFETERRLEKEYKGGRDIIYVKEEFENFELFSTFLKIFNILDRFLKIFQLKHFSKF